MNETVFSIILFILGLIIGIILLQVINYLKNKKNENKADMIVEKAKKDADKIKRESLFETKEEINKLKIETDKELKENAEGILSKLGISPSSAIQMLYSQIVLRNGMPFDLRLPTGKPVAAGGMNREQLDAELMKGMESLKSGKTYTVDEIDAELKKEFGI